MTARTPTVPAARRRPRDRKQRILAAAAQRFWTVGYHQVSMAGIAADVGIGASALYRHFGGKQELLLAVLDEALTALEQRTADVDDAAGAVAELAAYTVEHREFGVLWEREAGHLPEQDRRELRHRLRGLAARVRPDPAPGPQGDADLRAWAILSLLDSPSHHRRPLDPTVTRAVLVRAAEAVAVAPLPAADPPPSTETSAGLVPAARREALLAVAVRLFADRGYPSVSLDDIGAAAGIAGPSVYNHFASKIEMLEAALTRGNEALWLGLHSALAGARDPDDALARLAIDYSRFATANPHLISILVSETIHLPDERRKVFGRVQRDYLEEWVALVRAAQPDPGPATDAAVAAVRAALALANSLARIHHLRVEPGHAQRTAALVRAVLAVDRTPTHSSELPAS